MDDLQDMLRVQARLHRRQGAVVLADLFGSARSEIETLRTQLAKANERVRELEQFQQEIAYRCFLEGLNTEMPREPNAENGTATAINHFAVEVDRYARGSSRYILEQLRKEQASE